MTIFTWVKGLALNRPIQLFGTALGTALAVALIATLAGFAASSEATMTHRAIQGVGIDWQLQRTTSVSDSAAIHALRSAAPLAAVERVAYAQVAGFAATTGRTVQTTGSGVAVGLAPSYAAAFPLELRPLVGAASGVLLAQQTAANLHARPGDRVTIARIGMPPVSVKVDGIVDMPNADSFFQAVGVPAGSAPQAPPDNIVLLPLRLWHSLLDPQLRVRPDSVRTQLHARLDETQLPSAPDAAYSYVHERANNVEARIAGGGILADNLAARLLGVRADALYARVLFVFLGLPGLVLAALLTIAVAGSSERLRARDAAILRTRGASNGVLLFLVASEGLGIALAGTVLGLALAQAIAIWARQPGPAGSPVVVVGSIATAALLTIVALALPAWQQAGQTVLAGGQAVTRVGRPPLWKTLYLDAVLIIVALVVYAYSASTGYRVVLAPEGVPQASVSYQAFVPPLCLWLGIALLARRCMEWWLDAGRNNITALLRPLAAGLAPVVAASIARQRQLVAGGAVLVALAIAFALSTSVFNATYNAQSEVDAALTNGADVSISGQTASPPDRKLADLARIPDVRAAAAMQHRFAYVGTDLQDLYGIDPLTIGSATVMSDAYFASHNAASELRSLAANEDGVLVSAETAQSFALKQGDRLFLRLQFADHQYHAVPFHFLGVVREFPTAPRDSFLVANAAYVARTTGVSGREIVLLRTRANPSAVAAEAKRIVASLPGATVRDIESTRRSIGSSLTSVDLRGLTRIELLYALAAIAGATGLILFLGIGQRRRMFVLLWALGATPRQLASFWWSEAALIMSFGGAVGILLGFAVAFMLVKLLTGVFDPPPEGLSIPAGYLAALAIAGPLSMALAVVTAGLLTRKPGVADLRSG